MDEERRPRRVGPPERPGALGGKRDLNRKRRVEALVGAGMRLFLASGIEGVTIDEIAREAGMAKGNFYRYFRDKADLVEAVLEPVTAAVRRAIGDCDRMLRDAQGREDTVAAYYHLGTQLIATLAAYPDATRVYLQERRAPATPAREAISVLATELDERAIALTETAVERDLLSIRDPRISAVAVSGAVESLALAWLRQQFPMDPIDTANTLIGLVLDGIRKA
ncbi:MAG: TetR/AcrR family transcriptional regulator [Myxococcota bacterium]